MNGPDWESLYVRGLRRPEYTSESGDVFEFVRYRDAFAWQHQGWPKIVQLETAENWQATCRDAAVRWLLTQGSVVIRRFNPVEVNDEWGADLDEAMFFACKKALDALDAAKKKLREQMSCPPAAKP
jgi:hypothetical protein